MIHAHQVHLLTDAPLSASRARALCTTLVGDMNAALGAARTPAPTLRIGELRLDVPAAALADRGAMARYAREAVQRILDRTPE